jgi:hypothetical protein
MTGDELRKAEARYQRAFARAETEREARNAAVRTALEAGWTHARIAQATGLTRARVGQLALAGTMLEPTPANGPATHETPRPPAQQEPPLMDSPHHNRPRRA